jgi:hypothetical protein
MIIIIIIIISIIIIIIIVIKHLQWRGIVNIHSWCSHIGHVHSNTMCNARYNFKGTLGY